MARIYKRDQRGRFASTSGRGAKLTRQGTGGRLRKPATPVSAAKSKVAASPRRLNAEERAYVQVASQRTKFRSDTQRRAELSRILGRDLSVNDSLKLAQRTNSKLGVAPNMVPDMKARQAAYKKYLGSVSKKPRRR